MIKGAVSMEIFRPITRCKHTQCTTLVLAEKSYTCGTVWVRDTSRKKGEVYIPDKGSEYIGCGDYVCLEHSHTVYMENIVPKEFKKEIQTHTLIDLCEECKRKV